MKITIMQPTYLPWLGYFDLISKVDVFVFLDDVQFARRSWQQRNKILFQGKEKILSIPIIKKGKRDQIIKNVIIDDTQKWRQKHFKTLQFAYNKTLFGPKYLDIIKNKIFNPIQNLSNFNQEIIKTLSIELGLKTSFLKSSDLNSKGKKSKKLFNICSELNASSYLSPIGSKDYIQEEGFFNQSTIPVEYQIFKPKPYKQKNVSEFISSLSVVDFICSEGPKNFHKI